MSSVPPGGWDPDDTGAVPVGPEPEYTGTGTGGAGSGGWGEEPRTEPFAIAALVWAIVSIVLPIVGTIVAFVLAAKASDSIRRSQGTRSGTNLVNAARIVAGAVIALWAIGLVVFLATRDDGNTSNVATPTQPTATSTTLPASTTTRPLVTTTTLAPVTTTAPAAPTTSVGPTLPPVTTVAPPPPTTQAPPVTTTTAPPTTTTSPEQGEEARITQKLLVSGSNNQKIGPSNRGLPADERVSVTYVVGQPLVIQWGINNGAPPLPTGTADCPSTPPPPTPSSTTTLVPASTTTLVPSSTTSPTGTTVPASNATAQLARTEAWKILNVIAADIRNGRLNITGVQLIGTYPIEGADDGDLDVVQVFYTNAGVLGPRQATKSFQTPPADDVQCLNPAFD